MRYISSLAVRLPTEGKLDVTKDGLKLLTIEPEGMFGELALLYSCTHTYSVSGIKALCWLLGFAYACRYHISYVYHTETLVEFNCNSL